MAAGSIIIDLLAKTGSFVTDMARAEKSVRSFSKATKDSFLGNLGAGFARDFIQGIASIPGRMVDVVKSSIDAADHLNDLSKATGVSVETLGGIGFAAEQAGSSLDGVAKAVGKLNITLAKAASGNKEAQQALTALGVQAIDPLTKKTISADEALIQMADTIEKAGDSPEKFLAASKALGKQYQELVPLLADGGKALRENIAYYQRFGGVTTETAKKADEFNDTLGKIKLLTESFGRTLAAELLTPLTGIAEAFLNSKEKGDGFRTAAIGIKEALIGIAGVAAFVVADIAELEARLTGLVQRSQALGKALEKRGGKTALFAFPLPTIIGVGSDVKEEFGQISDIVDKEIAASTKRYEDFLALLREGGSTGAVPKKGGRVPGIPDPAVVAAAEAQLKKVLDGALQQIRTSTDQQQDALAFHNKLLEGEYQDGLVSLANFYQDQKALRERALQVQLDEQDKIIAAEQAFQKRTSSDAGKEEAQNKIDAARALKTRLIVKAGQDEQLALQQNARDVKALEDQFQGLNTQVLDLNENFAAAAAIKFDLQFFELRKAFGKNGNAEGLEFIDTLRAAAIAQGAFQKASLDAGRTLDLLSNQQDRIALGVQTGALTSIQALAEEGKARRAMIPFYEAQVEALEAIARANNNDPGLTAKADAARLALDKLKASADPLAESLNKVFEDGFGSAFGDFITGTKTASQAFKSFANSVINDLARMASKSAAEQIFGGSSGIGALLSRLLSSGGNTTQSGPTGGFDFSGTGFPLASGTNYVPYDGFKASLHEGEAVIPKAYNPASRGVNIKIENAPADHSIQGRQENDGTIVLAMQRIARQEISRAARPGGMTRQGLRQAPPDRN